MTLDKLIIEFDKGLKAVFASTSSAIRGVPGDEEPEGDLNESERLHAARLMRVNHSGEICAQALYQGQALVAKDEGVRAALEQAGSEEAEHLAWTEHRIHELGGRKSLLNPLWYGGALAVGLFAGRLGDAWNLGFLAETERQVESHLEDYKARLPLKDRRSWRILERMRQDESRHAHTAARLGARELPGLLKATMRCASRLMTRSSYRI